MEARMNAKHGIVFGLITSAMFSPLTLEASPFGVLPSGATQLTPTITDAYMGRTLLVHNIGKWTPTLDGNVATNMTSDYAFDPGSPYAVFDFGFAANLGVLKVANYQRAENFYNDRGFKDINIMVSPDATGDNWIDLGGFVLTRGYDGIHNYGSLSELTPVDDGYYVYPTGPGGNPAYPIYQSTLTLGGPLGVVAQRVRIDLLSSYSGNNLINQAPFIAGQNGGPELALSELAFFAVPVPEPTALGLLSLGAIGLLRRRGR
jgi:hypothetical protein